MNIEISRGRNRDDFRQNIPKKFDRIFKAQPVSYANKNDTKEINTGNKIFLPNSALNQLSQMNIQYPMMFKITNCQNKRSTHCSVLEFTSPEGIVYLPICMFHNLYLNPDQHGYIKLENISLQKGTFVKFQPFRMIYINEVFNQQAILENQLSSYACLTKGDILEISFQEKCFKIEVIELKPQNAVSIIETDINVEFERPKDLKNHEKRINLKFGTKFPSVKSNYILNESSDDDFSNSPKVPFVYESFKKSSYGHRLKDGKVFRTDIKNNLFLKKNHLISEIGKQDI